MRPHQANIMVNLQSSETSRWKAALPMVGNAEIAPTLVNVSAECGYEKYAIALPMRAWQQIVRGELVVIKQLVPVSDTIVPCEWHFNRFRRGNLFVDWGSGDLRFWIALEATDIRLGEQALLWEPEQAPPVSTKGATRAIFKTRFSGWR